MPELSDTMPPRHDLDLPAVLRALQESAERYRTLFESIDEGFCVIEVLHDDDGRPADYRFIEANPAFEQQTGLVNAVGHTARDQASTPSIK